MKAGLQLLGILSALIISSQSYAFTCAHPYVQISVEGSGESATVDFQQRMKAIFLADFNFKWSGCTIAENTEGLLKLTDCHAEGSNFPMRVTYMPKGGTAIFELVGGLNSVRMENCVGENLSADQVGSFEWNAIDTKP